LKNVFRGVKHLFDSCLFPLGFRTVRASSVDDRTKSDFFNSLLGVEANPTLYGQLKEKFANYIKIGQLVLLNVGIWPEPSVLKFYVNLDNDHWSSFDPAYGCRNGTRFETVDIQCFTATEILRRYGYPHYMKIDVEGADKHILSEFAATTTVRPTYISVEEFGITCIDRLRDLGYSRFKVVPQRDKTAMIPPNPPLEGTYVPRIFDGIDSGLFGAELPGEWMSYDNVRSHFVMYIRNENSKYIGPEFEWHDVHATL
jgi:FkbM family methyltransferase